MHADDKIGGGVLYYFLARAHVRLLEIAVAARKIHVLVARHHHFVSRFAQEVAQTERHAEIDVRLFHSRIRSHHTSVRSAVAGVYHYRHSVGSDGVRRRGRRRSRDYSHGDSRKGYYRNKGTFSANKESHTVTSRSPFRSASSRKIPRVRVPNSFQTPLSGNLRPQRAPNNRNSTT